jgi:hypothetical protein
MQTDKAGGPLITRRRPPSRWGCLAAFPLRRRSLPDILTLYGYPHTPPSLSHCEESSHTPLTLHTHPLYSLHHSSPPFLPFTLSPSSCLLWDPLQPDQLAGSCTLSTSVLPVAIQLDSDGHVIPARSLPYPGPRPGISLAVSLLAHPCSRSAGAGRFNGLL